MKSIIFIIIFSSSYLFLIYDQKDEEVYQQHCSRHFMVRLKICQFVVNINYNFFPACPAALMVGG